MSGLSTILFGSFLFPISVVEVVSLIRIMIMIIIIIIMLGIHRHSCACYKSLSVYLLDRVRRSSTDNVLCVEIVLRYTMSS